jgi:hypothetical protein
MSETVSDLQKSETKDRDVREINRICNLIANTSPENTQALFGNLQEMAELYYKGALTRADRSFMAAQVFGFLGIAYIAYVGYVCLHMANATTGKVLFHVFAGAIVSAISSLNFVLYYRATRQFELFHVCLERAGRFLMANSVSANIACSQKRDEAKADLVSTMANAPMLPLEYSLPRRKKVSAVPATSHRGPKPVAV